MKLLVQRLMLLILLGITLPICSFAQDSQTGIFSEKKSVIRYVTFETNAGQQQLLRTMVAAFEAKNPDIKIKIEPNIDAERIFVNDAAAGIPPDVVYIGKEHLPKLVSNNVLEPLDAYIKRDNINLDEYFPAVVDNLRYPNEKSDLYAFPIHFSTDALFYNEEIFDKAGIPYPDETWDWDKYGEVAAKLTSQPDKHGIKQVFGCLSVEQQILMGGNAAPCFDEVNNRIIVNNTTAVESLKWNCSLMGNQAPRMDEIADSDDMSLFTNSRLAMFIGRTWQLPEIDRRIGGKMRWNITHLPKGKVNRFSMLGVGGNCISHMSKNKEAAWRFVKFYSSEEGLSYISRGRKNCVPAMKTLALSEEFFLSPPPQNVKVFVDAVDYSGIYFPVTNWTSEFGTAIWHSYVQRAKAELPGWTPETALEQIELDGNALIAKTIKRQSRRNVAAAAQSGNDEILTSGATTNFIIYGLLAVMLIVLAAIAAVCRTDKRKWEGYAFIGPWIFGLCAFTLGPVAMSFYLAFCDYNVFSAPLWIGTENFFDIFKDPRYLNSLTNTIYYTAFVVPLSIIFSLGLAMLVNTKLPGAYTFRAIFYLPALTSGVAIALLWRWIFSPNLGLFNTMLGWIGIQGPGWLGSTHWALEAIIIMSIWGGLGGMMIIFLAGLQGIPTHLYEAADIDGATPWQKFWHVTRPMLSPTIFFNLIMSIIGSFQVFATVFVMTQSNGIEQEPGGPAGSTMVYILHLYQTGFRNLDMGQACAMAWVLFLIILALTGINAWLSKRWVHYDQS